MALITTTVTPTPQQVPYVGIEEISQDRSSLPKGELWFFADSPITVSGAGDYQSVVVNCNFPRNFAYALLDISYRIYGASVAITFDDVASFGIQNGFKFLGGTTSYASYELFTDGQMGSADVTTCAKIYALREKPTALVYADTNNESVQIIHNNINANQAQAVNVQMFCRFAQYTIEQANHVMVNTPQLVRP